MMTANSATARESISRLSIVDSGRISAAGTLNVSVSTSVIFGWMVWVFTVFPLIDSSSTARRQRIGGSSAASRNGG
ncbi:hypothetical protein SMICM304S_09618 [Streptomyces microflavus]